MILPPSVFWFSSHRKVLVLSFFHSRFSLFISRAHRAPSAVRAYRAPSAVRAHRAPPAARAHRAPSAARAHRAPSPSSGPPFEKTSEQLLLGRLHRPRRGGVRLRSCPVLQFLDRDIRFEVSG